MHVVKRLGGWLAHGHRDPRYIFLALLGIAVATYTTVDVLRSALPDSFDTAVFRFTNDLPGILYLPLLLITQLGSLGATLLWTAAAGYLNKYRTAGSVLASGVLAWILAKPLKVYIGRGRPGDFLTDLNIFNGENFVGLGYPSGHAAVVAACITALHFSVARKYRKYLWATVFLVGLSRVYLGGHYPRDVIGGWAIGMAVGSAVSLALGVNRNRITTGVIKSRLRLLGIDAVQVRYAAFDARGSVPVMIKDGRGRQFLGKLLSSQEHAADWAFKLFRLFRYKNTGAEEPYILSKRNAEHEILATLWAKKAGLRVADIVTYGKITNSWILVQDWIEGKTLSQLKAEDIKDTSLRDMWQQVRKLHDSNMAHRDLRAANVMVDAAGKAWLIDFGFAEIAPKKIEQLMDCAELVMSTALVVGPKRAAKAFQAVYTKKETRAVLPYLQTSVFSGATRAALKKHKPALKNIRQLLALASGAQAKHLETASIDRLSLKRLINIALFGILLLIVVPQFNTFKGALSNLGNVNPLWYPLLAALSAMTYLFSGLVFVSLANVPLKIRDSFLVQLSSSVASKLLPGGLGGATLNIQYLRAAGMENAGATNVIVASRLIGFVSFIVPIIFFLIVRGGQLKDLLRFEIAQGIIVLIVLVLLSLIAIMASFKKLRQKVTNFMAKMISDFRRLASSRKELSLALLFSLGITFSYVTALYVAMTAVGLRPSPIIAVAVFSTGLAASSVSPTPGGLGALEVAMASAMIALGFNNSLAYSAVILYRLTTFWIPLPFGILAYKYINKKRLINT